MSSHNAPGQMLGYLYQVRCALDLILRSDESNYQISLERFDDIAFEEDGDPRQLIQVKHHSKPGNLSDTSSDLWRTLKVWIDLVNENVNLLSHTEFVIITTADATEGSIAASIQSKDYDGAYEALVRVARAAGNHSNEKFYEAFLNMHDEKPESLKNLVSRIRIISSVENVEDIEKRIEGHLQLSCMPKYIQRVRETLEGWWFSFCIRALSSPDPVTMTRAQVCEKIVMISYEYRDDDLPIEYASLKVDKSAIGASDRVFLKQLEILNCRERTLNIALRDYYRARKERSSWTRHGLLYPDELEDYERKLEDEWENAFARMEDDLAACGGGATGGVTEEKKAEEGRSLYREVTGKDIRIRARVDQPYVMRGTYHEMANTLKVGWHVDYLERLKGFLKEAK